MVHCDKAQCFSMPEDVKCMMNMKAFEYTCTVNMTNIPHTHTHAHTLGEINI